jgi:uncharacterized protein
MAANTDNPQEGTTEVISHEIRPGRGREFDDCLRRILELKVRSPGYLGTTVISPSGDESRLHYVVTRFRDTASLEAWRRSPDRARFFDEVGTYAIPHLD